MTTPALNDDLVRELNVLATSLCVDEPKMATLVYDAINALEILAAENAALRSESDALRAAISWIEPPFVDDLTPHQELRFRVNQCVKDAARTLTGARHEQ